MTKASKSWRGRGSARGAHTSPRAPGRGARRAWSGRALGASRTPRAIREGGGAVPSSPVRWKPLSLFSAGGPFSPPRQRRARRPNWRGTTMVHHDEPTAAANAAPADRGARSKEQIDLAARKRRARARSGRRQVPPTKTHTFSPFLPLTQTNKQAKKSQVTVGPVVLGFFLFVVVGSGAFVCSFVWSSDPRSRRHLFPSRRAFVRANRRPHRPPQKTHDKKPTTALLQIVRSAAFGN